MVTAVPPNPHALEIVAAFNPAVKGFPRIVIWQLDPLFRFANPHVFPVIVKFVVSLIEGDPHDVAGADPELFNIKVCVDEFDPTFIFPKLFVNGDHANTGSIPVDVI